MNIRRRSLTWEVDLITVAIALLSVHGAASHHGGFMYVDAVGVPAVLASLLIGMRSGVRIAAAEAMRAYPPATILLWNGVQAVIDGVSAWIVAGALAARRAASAMKA